MADRSKKSFETMLSELEEIVRKLESGEASLEEAMEMYKKGALLASECSKLLDAAEKQIKVLVKTEDGEMSERDFFQE